LLEALGLVHEDLLLDRRMEVGRGDVPLMQIQAELVGEGDEQAHSLELDYRGRDCIRGEINTLDLGVTAGDEASFELDRPIDQLLDAIHPTTADSTTTGRKSDKFPSSHLL
jgi:hypothetical protein